MNLRIVFGLGLVLLILGCYQWYTLSNEKSSVDKLKSDLDIEIVELGTLLGSLESFYEKVLDEKNLDSKKWIDDDFKNDLKAVRGLDSQGEILKFLETGNSLESLRTLRSGIFGRHNFRESDYNKYLAGIVQQEVPVTNPPVTNPPVTNPPVTNPPVTNPPVTNPPVTNPPVTNPPVTNPISDSELSAQAQLRIQQMEDSLEKANQATEEAKVALVAARDTLNKIESVNAEVYLMAFKGASSVKIPWLMEKKGMPKTVVYQANKDNQSTIRVDLKYQQGFFQDGPPMITKVGIFKEGDKSNREDIAKVISIERNTDDYKLVLLIETDILKSLTNDRRENRSDVFNLYLFGKDGQSLFRQSEYVTFYLKTNTKIK